MNKYQKQLNVIEYRGYQFRKSSETGHTSIWRQGHGGIWERLCVRNDRRLAEAYVDELCDQAAKVLLKTVFKTNT